MAEALVSILIEGAFITSQQLDEEVRLVKDVDKHVIQLKNNLEAIQVVLEDAERRQLADLNVRNWLDKLKTTSFDMDNLLDKWSTAILKLNMEERNVPSQTNIGEVCFSIPSPVLCFTSKFKRITLHRDIARKIKDLNKRLERIVVEKDRFRLNTTVVQEAVLRPKTTSFINEAEIYGRDMEKHILVSKLVSETSSDQDRRLDIIPIIGMGGIGKTTLAQLVFNDEKIKAHFDTHVWVCVSEPFEEIKVAKAIIESIEGNAPNINELETLLQHIRKCIERKRFLLILDDVWTEDKQKWEQFKQTLSYGAIGSRVLVTSRKKEVAIIMEAVNYMITLEKLSEEHCWLVFKQQAFLERKEEECKLLEEIGQKIASKANGSPLIAKTLGSLMCFKKTEDQWRKVLESKLWQLKDDKKIFAPFLLSYYDLTAKEKRCLSYCSIFPKDHLIVRNELIELWMSQNYLGRGINSKEEGHDCFDTLLMRSFFQNFERLSNDDSITHCKMHDIVHDFVQFLTKDECVAIEVLDDVEEKLKPVDDKARHLTLVVGSDARFPIPEYSKLNEKNLRTLFIVSNTNNCIIDTSLFSRLTCLRTLILSKCGIQRLPKSIGKLIHLRYLNLESNPNLMELPNAICGLCNLQTLNLDYCTALSRLPDGMFKLVNLKHLYIKSCYMLEGLPRGIVCLVSLERLNMLVIPKDKGSYFDIGDLKKLDNLQLRGSLHIKECRNIKNVNEIEQINLKNSKDIVSLSLDFGWLGKLETGFEDDITILEALEPHQNLLELIISNYMGPNLSPSPNWMMLLIHLRKLALLFCENCESIPSFGRLPSLEVLQLAGLKNVKNVGLEFLGITEKRDEDDDATLNNPVIVFPKLKRLVFINMEQLEKWEGGDTSLVIMPCLKRLELEGCPHLLALPDLLQATTSLKYLSISKSEIVEGYCQRRTDTEWDKISNIPNITLNDKIVRKDGIWIQEDNNNDVIGTSSSPK